MDVTDIRHWKWALVWGPCLFINKSSQTRSDSKLFYACSLFVGPDSIRTRTLTIGERFEVDILVLWCVTPEDTSRFTSNGSPLATARLRIESGTNKQRKHTRWCEYNICSLIIATSKTLVSWLLPTSSDRFPYI